MVTVADGRPDVYDYENTARYHTPEEAITNDKLLQAIYSEHKNVFVIGNDGSKGFEDKMERTIDAIKTTLGNQPIGELKLC